MLLRPSKLARAWELHPKTVYAWIKSGKLPAVTTPGDQYRVRSEDVPPFCERSGLPVPRAILAEKNTVTILGATASAQRTIRNVLKGKDAVVTWHANPIEGLVMAVEAPPSLLIVDASSVDAEAAARALRRAKSTRDVSVLAYQIPNALRAAAIRRAGARWALVKDKDLAATLDVALSAG